MRRAWSRSSFPRPRLAPDQLEFQLAFGLAVRPADDIAALTAAFSCVTPFANAATRLVLARSIQGSSPAGTLLRIIAWKSATTLRASREVQIRSRPRPRLRSRPWRAGRARSSSAERWFVRRERGLSHLRPSFRWPSRALHSLTTQRHPRNPRCFRERHSSRVVAPAHRPLFVQPGKSSQSELLPTRKTSDL